MAKDSTKLFLFNDYVNIILLLMFLFVLLVLTFKECNKSACDKNVEEKKNPQKILTTKGLPEAADMNDTIFYNGNEYN